MDWAVPKDTYLTATLEGKDKARSEELLKTKEDQTDFEEVPIEQESEPKVDSDAGTSSDEDSSDDEAASTSSNDAEINEVSWNSHVYCHS